MVPVTFRVVLDANVLFPFSLRDTLLRAAAAGYFQVYWSTEILDETSRNTSTLPCIDAATGTVGFHGGQADDQGLALFNVEQALFAIGNGWCPNGRGPRRARELFTSSLPIVQSAVWFNLRKAVSRPLLLDDWRLRSALKRSVLRAEAMPAGYPANRYPQALFA
jgi:hypothetical protein